MENEELKQLWYSLKEFAALFGKEKTWGYRLAYAGKIRTITEYGVTKVPHSEVERLLNDKSRYLGRRSRKPKTEGGDS